MNKKYFYNVILAASCMMLFISNISGQTQNVAINNTGNLPDNSAMLDVSATDKGILIPRMSTSQRTAIASPAKGLLVFDNDLSQFWYYNGTAWTVIGGGGSTCSTLEQAYNCGGAGLGRTINANSGAVEVSTSSSAVSGFKSTHTNTGVAVNASSTLAGNTYSTVQATTASSSNLVSAVLGNSSAAALGVSGQVQSTGTGQAGVYGNNLRTTGGHGVWGFGFNGTVGETNYTSGYGVFGQNNYASGTGDGVGVAGVGQTGVMGQTIVGTTFGVYGENICSGTTDNNVGVAGWGWVGVFGQDDGTGFGVYSDGELGSSGTKSFMIDHPLDPANKFLKHFCLESNEVLNVYRGNVTLDNKGEAQVALPDYFKEININFSYNLTAIGSTAPGLFIKEEINENTFRIGGGAAGQKVSWTVYAERNDKYVQAKPSSKQVEVQKRSGNIGKYLRPELYNQPASKAIFQKPNKSNKPLGTATQQQPVLNVLDK